MNSGHVLYQESKMQNGGSDGVRVTMSFFSNDVVDVYVMREAAWIDEETTLVDHHRVYQGGPSLEAKMIRHAIKTFDELLEQHPTLSSNARQAKQVAFLDSLADNVAALDAQEREEKS